MKRFQFDERKPIDRFGSLKASISPITRIIDSHIEILQIAMIQLGEGGILGGHEAGVPQMFIVVSGEGLVTGGDRLRHPIRAGQLALWDEGEWHETTTEGGLTAIVIETETLEPFPKLEELV